jgi:lipopolysaccharide export system permease protein
VLPVSVLLSILIVFGLMNKHHEIIALNSSGISIYYLFKPVLLIGLSASVALFFFSETVVPVAVEKADKIWRQEVRHESSVQTKENDIWLKDHRMIINIRYYHPMEKAVFGISLNYFDENFRLIRRTDAKKGIFKNGIWVMYDVLEQISDPKTGQYLVNIRDEIRESLNIQPKDLQMIVKQSKQMSYTELSDYIRKVENEGYDAASYRTDLHAKIAFPSICLILSVLGAGLAAKTRFRDGLSANIAYGIGLAFVYWIVYSFCLSLGYGDMLPPIIAAYAANAIFLCFGIILLIKASETI